MKSPKKVVFAWAPSAGAEYYNVQIFRNRRKVSAPSWPKTNRMTLKSTWRFQKKKYALSKGVYTWYVWPGVGARSANRYGPQLGQSTFTVSG